MVPMSSSEFAYNNISSDDKTLQVRKSDKPSTAGCVQVLSLHYSLKVTADCKSLATSKLNSGKPQLIYCV